MEEDIENQHTAGIGVIQTQKWTANDFGPTSKTRAVQRLVRGGGRLSAPSVAPKPGILAPAPVNLHSKYDFSPQIEIVEKKIRAAPSPTLTKPPAFPAWEIFAPPVKPSTAPHSLAATQEMMSSPQPTLMDISSPVPVAVVTMETVVSSNGNGMDIASPQQAQPMAIDRAEVSSAGETSSSSVSMETKTVPTPFQGMWGSWKSRDRVFLEGAKGGPGAAAAAGASSAMDIELSSPPCIVVTPFPGMWVDKEREEPTEKAPSLGTPVAATPFPGMWGAAAEKASRGIVGSGSVGRLGQGSKLTFLQRLESFHEIKKLRTPHVKLQQQPTSNARTTPTALLETGGTQDRARALLTFTPGVVAPRIPPKRLSLLLSPRMAACVSASRQEVGAASSPAHSRQEKGKPLCQQQRRKRLLDGNSSKRVRRVQVSQGTQPRKSDRLQALYRLARGYHCDKSRDGSTSAHNSARVSASLPSGTSYFSLSGETAAAWMSESAARDAAALSAWVNHTLYPSWALLAASKLSHHSMAQARGISVGEISQHHAAVSSGACNHSPNNAMELLLQRLQLFGAKLAGRLSREAFSLACSPPIRSAFSKLNEAIAAGRLCLAPGLNPHTDGGLKSRVTGILMAYSPAWLALGLQAVLGESVVNLPDPSSQQQQQQQQRVSWDPQATLNNSLRKCLLSHIFCDSSVTAEAIKAAAPSEVAVDASSIGNGAQNRMNGRAASSNRRVSGGPTPLQAQGIFRHDASHAAAQRRGFISRVLRLMVFLDAARLSPGFGNLTTVEKEELAQLSLSCATLPPASHYPTSIPQIRVLAGIIASGLVLPPSLFNPPGVGGGALSDGGAKTRMGNSSSYPSTSSLLTRAPLTFRSSQEIILDFGRACLLGGGAVGSSGDVVKFLESSLGIHLGFVQTRAHEVAVNGGDKQPVYFSAGPVNSSITTNNTATDTLAVHHHNSINGGAVSTTNIAGGNSSSASPQLALTTSFKDGVRLARLTECLWGLDGLSSGLLPPLSRTNKVHNVALALKAVESQLGLSLSPPATTAGGAILGSALPAVGKTATAATTSAGGVATSTQSESSKLECLGKGLLESVKGVSARDIVDAMPAKVSALLWSLLLNTGAASNASLANEIAFLRGLQERMKGTTVGTIPSSSSFVHASIATISPNSPRATLLLAWLTSLCTLYAFPAPCNWTSPCILDGTALCLLLSHYLPEALPLASIHRDTTTQLLRPSSSSSSAAATAAAASGKLVPLHSGTHSPIKASGLPMPSPQLPPTKSSYHAALSREQGNFSRAFEVIRGAAASPLMLGLQTGHGGFVVYDSRRAPSLALFLGLLQHLLPCLLPRSKQALAFFHRRRGVAAACIRAFFQGVVRTTPRGTMVMKRGLMQLKKQQALEKKMLADGGGDILGAGYAANNAALPHTRHHVLLPPPRGTGKAVGGRFAQENNNNNNNSKRAPFQRPLAPVPSRGFFPGPQILLSRFDAIKTIQRAWCVWRFRLGVRRHFYELARAHAATRIQRLWRGILGRKTVLEMRRREACLRQVGYMEEARAVGAEQILEEAAHVVTRAVRAAGNRLRSERRYLAATTIQAAWRMYATLSNYRFMIGVSTIVQAVWRGHRCRKARAVAREAESLRLAAEREAEALWEAECAARFLAEEEEAAVERQRAALEEERRSQLASEAAAAQAHEVALGVERVRAALEQQRLEEFKREEALRREAAEAAELSAAEASLEAYEEGEGDGGVIYNTSSGSYSLMEKSQDLTALVGAAPEPGNRSSSRINPPSIPTPPSFTPWGIQAFNQIDALVNNSALTPTSPGSHSRKSGSYSHNSGSHYSPHPMAMDECTPASEMRNPPGVGVDISTTTTTTTGAIFSRVAVRSSLGFSSLQHTTTAPCQLQLPPPHPNAPLHSNSTTTTTSSAAASSPSLTSLLQGAAQQQIALLSPQTVGGFCGIAGEDEMEHIERAQTPAYCNTREALAETQPLEAPSSCGGHSTHSRASAGASSVASTESLLPSVVPSSREDVEMFALVEERARMFMQLQKTVVKKRAVKSFITHHVDDPAPLPPFTTLMFLPANHQKVTEPIPHSATLFPPTEATTRNAVTMVAATTAAITTTTTATAAAAGVIWHESAVIGGGNEEDVGEDGDSSCGESLNISDSSARSGKTTQWLEDCLAAARENDLYDKQQQQQRQLFSGGGGGGGGGGVANTISPQGLSQDLPFSLSAVCPPFTNDATPSITFPAFKENYFPPPPPACESSKEQVMIEGCLMDEEEVVEQVEEQVEEGEKETLTSGAWYGGEFKGEDFSVYVPPASPRDSPTPILTNSCLLEVASPRTRQLVTQQASDNLELLFPGLDFSFHRQLKSDGTKVESPPPMHAASPPSYSSAALLEAALRGEKERQEVTSATKISRWFRQARRGALFLAFKAETLHLCSLMRPAAVLFQAAWRGYRTYHSFKSPLDSHRFIARLQRLGKEGACPAIVKFQSLVRGALTRMRVFRHDKVWAQVRARCANAARDAALGMHETIAVRSRRALYTLSTSLSLSQLLPALTDLEMATRYSIPAALTTVSVNAGPTLFTIARAGAKVGGANHVILLRKALLIILNLLSAGERTATHKRGSGPMFRYGPPTRNAVAVTLCCAENVATLLYVGERAPTDLPTLRPVLTILILLLECSPRARKRIAGCSATMDKLRTLRGSMQTVWLRMRTNPKAQLCSKKIAQLKSLWEAGKIHRDDFNCQRAELQRQAAAEVGVNCGSEGFSVESTVKQWEILFSVLMEEKS